MAQTTTRSAVGAPDRPDQATAASSKGNKFRPDIQGLRAIAVCAVVLYHAGVPFLTGGYVGVDVFFVISGFLITSHLLAGLRRDGRVRFAEFYARRARRILPASLLVVLLSVLAALIWYPPLLMGDVWLGAVATAFYVPNYLFAVQGTDYLSETTPSLFQHYWSLGIEEQFYMIWPLVLMILFALFRTRKSVLFGVVVLLVGASFAACVILTFRSQPWAFFALPTRAWELGVGGLAAFVLSHRPGALRGWVATATGWIGIAGILAAVLLFNSDVSFPGYAAALPVVATALVIIGGDRTSRFSPSGLLSLRGMQFIGLISYSLYLVHWPLLLIPQAAVGFNKPLPLAVTLGLGLLSVPIAWLLYRFVENPARAARWLVGSRPRRSLLAALAGSVIVALLATSALLYSSSVSLYVPATKASAPELNPPTFTDFVPANLRPSLRDASHDQPVIYADGCQRGFGDRTLATCVYGNADLPRIVLFGDSHAAQWFPAVFAFAQMNGYSVEVQTKSSCPSALLDVMRNGVPYTDCSDWRETVIEHLNDEEPALVVIANYSAARTVKDSREYGTVWSDALGATITRLDAPVAVIADTPDMGETPAICLSAHLTDSQACAVPRDAAQSAPSRQAERLLAASLSIPFIDLNDSICSETTCAPIIGDTLVYRDAHHLTATFAAELAKPLGEALQKALAAGR